MIAPISYEVTSGLLWWSSMVLGLMDLGLVWILARRVKRTQFKRLAWAVAITAGVFFGGLWTFVLWWSWDWVYGYIFPAWMKGAGPLFGLPYALVGLGMWWFARRLPGNAALSFCLLGGMEGLATHWWAIYRLDFIEQVPMMEWVSPIPVLVFATFEKVFYWGVILGLAALAGGLVHREVGSKEVQSRS